MTDNREWVNVYVGYEHQDYPIADVPLRQYDRIYTGETITLAHRADDSSPTDFVIFEITVENETMRLAITEIMPMVYSLYIFMEKPDNFKETRKVEAIKAYLARNP